MWDVYLVFFGLVGFGIVFGICLERMLLNQYAFVRFQNLFLKKDKGIAFIFTRSRLHRKQVIDLGQHTFKQEGTNREYHIAKDKTEIFAGVPCVYYIEDSTEPISPSGIGKPPGGISPDALHEYVLLTIAHLKAREVENIAKFFASLRWVMIGIAVGVLLILVLIFTQGGSISQVGNICATNLEATQNISRYVMGG